MRHTTKRIASLESAFFYPATVSKTAFLIRYIQILTKSIYCNFSPSKHRDAIADARAMWTASQHLQAISSVRIDWDNRREMRGWKGRCLIITTKNYHTNPTSLPPYRMHVNTIFFSVIYTQLLRSFPIVHQFIVTISTRRNLSVLCQIILIELRI